MQILKTQKNLLFDLVNQKGFSPSSFSIADNSHGRYRGMATALKYNFSNYYYLIYKGEVDRYFYIDYSPADGSFEKLDHITSQWEDVANLFYHWLELLKREVDAIDKWAQLKTETPDFSLIENNSNSTKFSYDEVLLIETKIKTLKNSIHQIPLTEQQLAAFDAKLDYSIELAKTANKFDWTAYFIGVITAIIIQLTVTPQNASAVWEAVKHAFSNFLLL